MNIGISLISPETRDHGELDSISAEIFNRHALCARTSDRERSTRAGEACTSDRQPVNGNPDSDSDSFVCERIFRPVQVQGNSHVSLAAAILLLGYKFLIATTSIVNGSRLVNSVSEVLS